jgi:hypothetical protein
MELILRGFLKFTSDRQEYVMSGKWAMSMEHHASGDASKFVLVSKA